eukprot:CAMPEP_0197541666 /NCGR_PEP_ID=MMETSP1318-20131121/67286_1 /TAXON_ID=552666 /ORGANISM="Partenskyella glossopodia, Strain RCC365" /LENGTH=243 /DNA_ID=CAMNT_0043100867 /DNA_START=12 /DNA_END=740 /DNA_ORIENTATION=-
MTSRQPAQIILFGDSITQQSFREGGWGARLACQYSRRADVINRGFSGYNTAWALFTLSDVFRSNTPTPALITILYGPNDACDPKVDARQYVPVDKFKENLGKIITHIRQTYHQPRILLLSPPPVEHSQRLEWQRKRYKDEATGLLERTLTLASMYAKAVDQVGKEHNVPSVNLCQLMTSMGDIKPFFWDGLHLTSEGNKVVFEAVVKAIDANFPEIAVKLDPVTGSEGNSATDCKALPKQFPW